MLSQEKILGLLMCLTAPVGITDRHGRKHVIRRNTYFCSFADLSLQTFLFCNQDIFFVKIFTFMVKIRMHMAFQAFRIQMLSFSICVYVYGLKIQIKPQERQLQKLNWSVCKWLAPFKNEKPTRVENTLNSLNTEELSILKY